MRIRTSIHIELEPDEAEAFRTVVRRLMNSDVQGAIAFERESERHLFEDLANAL